MDDDLAGRERRGRTTLETQSAIFIDGQPFTVIGILDDVARKPGLLLSVWRAARIQPAEALRR